MVSLGMLGVKDVEHIISQTLKDSAMQPKLVSNWRIRGRARGLSRLPQLFGCRSLTFAK